jgi:hypothetical protein
MCMVSMPAMILTADLKDLNPIIGRVRLLMALWSCSTMLFKYLHCRSSMSTPLSATSARTAAVLAPLLSMVIFFGHVVQVDRALEEATRSGHVTVGGQEEVHRLAELVDRAVQVLPLTAYQHIGLVDSPGTANRQLAAAQHRRQYRQHLQRPAVNGCVVDQHATLGHHLFKVAQTQRVGGVPPHAHQHDFQREVQPLDDAAQGRIDQLNMKWDHALDDSRWSPARLSGANVAPRQNLP